MWNEAQLDEALSTPSQALIDDMAKLDGDIMILGAGGKVGPTLSVMAKRAVEASGVDRKVIAVSRFTDPFVVELLNREKVETISCDLTKPEQIATLPKVKNIIYNGMDNQVEAAFCVKRFCGFYMIHSYFIKRNLLFAANGICSVRSFNTPLEQNTFYFSVT